MNENLYTGGYMKGHFALVGVTDNGDVQPEPAATLWGDTASEVHGDIANRIQVEGVVAMLSGEM